MPHVLRITALACAAALAAPAADNQLSAQPRQRGQQLGQPPVRPDRRKDLGMLHLAGHHHLGDALRLENVDQHAELPQRKPVATRGQRLHFPGSFFLDGDYGDVVPQPPRAFERQEGEPSIAGDQPVAHYFTKPRSEERMKSINPSTSAQGATSARMRSIACDVLSCDLVNKRKAVCRDSTAAFSMPRRSKPTLLAPKTPNSGL